MVDEITAYLKERGASRLDAAYGCSLGGACLTRMLALVIIEGLTIKNSYKGEWKQDESAGECTLS